jgi:hypothetical protein
MNKKKCVICKREIKDDDDYFKVELFIKGDSKGIDYAHRICWINRNNFNNQIGTLVRGVSEFATKNGIIPEKPIECVI